MWRIGSSHFDVFSAIKPLLYDSYYNNRVVLLEEQGFHCHTKYPYYVNLTAHKLLARVLNQNFYFVNVFMLIKEKSYV